MHKSVQIKHIADRDILEAIVHRAEQNAIGNPGVDFPPDLLADRFPPRVTLGKIEQMERRGILNCGVSLRGAWIDDREWLLNNHPDLAERLAASEKTFPRRI